MADTKSVTKPAPKPATAANAPAEQRRDLPPPGPEVLVTKPL